MQFIIRQDGRCFLQKMLVGTFVLLLFGLTGCQRLGMAVSKYLPAKSQEVAAQEDTAQEPESSPAAASPDSTPMENMGGDPTAGGFDDPLDAGSDDELQNFGPENGATFDPANDVTLEADAGVGTGPETDPLEGDGTDHLEDAASLTGQYTGDSVADPAGKPQGDPGLATAGGGFAPTNNGPGVGSPGAGNTGRSRPTSKRGRNSNSSRKGNTNPNNMRIEEPQGKPIIRLTANAVVPAQTTEGQRVGFSVEYELQRSGLSPNGEFGLVIESAKNGRYGTAVRLGEGGTLQVGAVPQFRPTSGPFKAFLVQKTRSGMQRISNIVEFKTLY